MSLADRYRAKRDEGFNPWGAGLELKIAFNDVRKFEQAYQAAKRAAARGDAIPKPYKPGPSFGDGGGAPVGYDDGLDNGYVRDCLERGSFPRAIKLRGDTVWLAPGDRIWNGTEL